MFFERLKLIFLGILDGLEFFKNFWFRFFKNFKLDSFDLSIDILEVIIKVNFFKLADYGLQKIEVGYVNILTVV